MFKPTLYLFIIFLSAGCHSSKVSVPPGTKTAGKKIVIGNIYMNSVQKNKNDAKKDTICVCVGQAVQEAFIPYLQQAGFTVIKAPIEPKMNLYKSLAIADSLKADYLLTGKGIVDIYKSASYIDEMTANIIDVKNQSVLISSSFSGTVVRPAKAAGHVGQKLVKMLQ